MQVLDDYIYDLCHSTRRRYAYGDWVPPVGPVARLGIEYRVVSGATESLVMGTLFIEPSGSLADSTNRLTWSSSAFGSGIIDNIPISVGSGQRQDLHTFDVATVANLKNSRSTLSARLAGISRGGGEYTLQLDVNIPIPEQSHDGTLQGIQAVRVGDAIELQGDAFARHHYEIRRRTVAGDPTSPWGLWSKVEFPQYSFTLPVSPGWDYQMAVVNQGHRLNAVYYFRTLLNTVRMYEHPFTPTIHPIGMLSTLAPARFAWDHNPGDGSQQSAAEVNYRLVGGGSWTTLTVTGPHQWVETPAPLAAGDYELRVVTYGVAVAGSNPASATFTVSAPPTVTIVSPADGAVLDTNRLSLAVAWSDPQGAAMVGWTRSLLRGDDLVEQVSGTGGASAMLFDAVLDDDEAYIASVIGHSGTGLASDPATITISTAFRAPAPPALSAVWDEDAGVTRLAATYATDPLMASAIPGQGVPGLIVPGSDGTEFDPTVSGRIERSEDAGSTWQVAPDDGMLLPTTLDDWMAPINHDDVRYRAVAASSIGVESHSAPVAVTTPSHRVWLRARDGFTACVQLNMDLAPTLGHHVVIEDYGRVAPVAHHGVPLPVSVGVSGVLIEGHGLTTDWTRFLGAVVWARLPTAVPLAMWATIDASGFSLPQSNSAVRHVSFTLEQTNNTYL